ncbi:MAG: hypothetical protein GY773_09790 [Actinomycetia bacterium]|nr:hypothetical protein [Actinomycetes bacterium]
MYGPEDWADYYSPTELAHIHHIIAVAARVFNMTADQLCGHIRRKRFIKARHATVAVLREECDLSYPHLGAIFDGRDHTTMMHAVDRAGDERNPTLTHEPCQ